MNTGYATIEVDTDRITVNHKINGTPSYATACPLDSNIGSGMCFWIGSFDGSSITIYINKKASAPIKFSWMARLYDN
ncbi:hypothetical protein [Sodalis glossinidius]|uniref:hypothetical protein n=1 Tax=Sodalis glossinidius TaxID=63612 RepID=UPI0011D0F495|nr:hypothetical protein [Sodalis glossinidius]